MTGRLLLKRPLDQPPQRTTRTTPRLRCRRKLRREFRIITKVRVILPTPLTQLMFD